MELRRVDKLVTGIATQDGGGVRLKRLIAQPSLMDLDPFLLFDEFKSDDPSDYLAGFPSHPHRGFQTVTYMLAGKMQHQDSIGNKGAIEPGGVQWMNAGKGIIHSEMPLQRAGRMHGFQLWVNLPASQKMSKPDYQDITASEVPEVNQNSLKVRVIAGEYQDVVGPVKAASITPVILDFSNDEPSPACLPLPSTLNAFIYCIQGNLIIGGQQVKANQLAVLDGGNTLQMTLKTNSRCLLIAGKPVNEPVARYGPIVMNTQEEVEQALQDYRQGTFSG